MNQKLLVCLALVLGGAMTSLAQGEPSPLLRVVAIPSLKTVHTNEGFAIAVSVENLAKTNYFLHTGSQDSWMDWRIDNPDICLVPGPLATANIPIVINVLPGGQYTNEIGAFMCKPISPGTLAFRIGFTPRDDTRTFWSNKCSIKIIRAEPSGATNGTLAAVAKVKLTFVSVDSEETYGENGYGENAVDGDPNTIWHTQWRDRSPGFPHEIVIELVPPSIISGFSYLPRQDPSDHGTIKDFEFYASDDDRNFGPPIKTGTFGPGKEEKIENFEPVKCRFIKLKAVSEINGLPFTSAAEIRVIQPGEDDSAKDYWRGDVGPAPVPQDSIRPNAVDSFVAASQANGGLWLNGTDGMSVPATTPQQVISETFRAAHFQSGMLTHYRILDLRKVNMGGELGTYTAALADTNLGEMIVIMQNTSKPGYWWRRIYYAGAPYNRLD